MMKYLLTIALLLLLKLAYAQHPKEDARLHYRLIYFSPSGKEADATIDIAKGKWDKADSFEKNIIIRNVSAGVIEVPYWNQSYTWRYRNSKKQNKFNHFSTLTCPELDTTQFRFRVIQPAVAYKDAYYFVDVTKMLYDANGKPVWFLPEKGRVTRDFFTKDVKFTDRGTITFLLENYKCLEIDYDGNIVWETPAIASVSGDSLEHFHHEFTRLSNGHYMTLGSEIGLLERSMLKTADDIELFMPDEREKMNKNLPHTPVPFGTLIEYDEKGNVVWSWKSSEIFKRSDIFYHRNKRGVIDLATHANSFYFDEERKLIYVSCRDIDRILKVGYPDGKVIAQYGNTFTKGQPDTYNGLYCKQHSVSVSADKNLFIFNNNLCHDTDFPKIVLMKEPLSNTGQLKKIWEYTCTIEGENGTSQTNYAFNFGGTVSELPDGCVFACMSSLYSKLFIVTREKKEVWSGIPESWDKMFKRWQPMLLYKASIIPSRSQLEKAIIESARKNARD